VVFVVERAVTLSNLSRYIELGAAPLFRVFGPRVQRQSGRFMHSIRRYFLGREIIRSLQPKPTRKKTAALFARQVAAAAEASTKPAEAKKKKKKRNPAKVDSEAKYSVSKI
jgi:hypothetical protein